MTGNPVVVAEGERALAKLRVPPNAMEQVFKRLHLTRLLVLAPQAGDRQSAASRHCLKFNRLQASATRDVSMALRFVDRSRLTANAAVTCDANRKICGWCSRAVSWRFGARALAVQWAGEERRALEGGEV